mmetsp:Transcript_13397/g.39185  ORF Transcript_13397/g.39185 Transcript_13397/m.39185 type:complete len:122 (+) Transcript_13397:1166-1531(+)
MPKLGTRYPASAWMIRFVTCGNDAPVPSPPRCPNARPPPQLPTHSPPRRLFEDIFGKGSSPLYFFRSSTGEIKVDDGWVIRSLQAVGPAAPLFPVINKEGEVVIRGIIKTGGVPNDTNISH